MSDKTKKALNIILDVLTILIILFTVLILCFTLLSRFVIDKEDASLFGYRVYTVASDSMKGVFEAGDLIFVKTDENFADLADGEIITFYSADPDSLNEIITHKIRSSAEYEGRKVYTTYGVATGVDDRYPVYSDNIIGVYKFRLAGVGNSLTFIRTPLGYFLIVFIPFALIIGINIGSIVKKVRAINNEKQRVEEERQNEIERMRGELDALRRQMSEAPRNDALPEGTTEEEHKGDNLSS